MTLLETMPLSKDSNVSDAPPSYTALDPLPRLSQYSSAAHAEDQRAGLSVFARARKAVEAKKTVLEVLRDLVKQPDTPRACLLLNACADACTTYKHSLPTLLQEKTIEGRTPLYWAIINRPACSDDTPDIVSLLISHTAPLTDATIDEVRLACLHVSDNALFQRLRSSSEFAPLSGKDEIVAGGTKTMDVVVVEDAEHDAAAFIVKLRVPMFQKRMRVSEEIRLEFIAKGRLWELTFLVVKSLDKRLNYESKFREGSWVVKLALLRHSSPTWIDGAYLIIDDPCARDSTPEPNPQIKVPLESKHQLTAPYSSGSYDGKMVAVAFETHAEMNTLQFTSCPYLDADGALVARVEGRLVRPQGAVDPQSGCIVC
ncbi:hypothetical protein C8Q76DRAFT_205042 [Earliella scabrosa]|nr:hypothetical protein C8Q76DRAFT_205042 [Earliella scabrosa]